MSLAPQLPRTAGPVVQTGRLALVAVDRELARLQQEDPPGFFEALGARREPSWPPELTSEESIAWMRGQLEENPDLAGWYSWVFLMEMGPGQAVRAVGIGGFHGPPDAQGEVEISYSMLPSFREQGLATEAVDGLLGWAKDQPGAERVVANTVEHLYASRRVLEKTGFEETGIRETEDGQRIVEYARSL